MCLEGCSDPENPTMEHLRNLKTSEIYPFGKPFQILNSLDSVYDEQSTNE